MRRKNVLLFLPLALMLTMPVQARKIEGNVYKVCRNGVFTDYENGNVKKIVTMLNEDGTFQAEDLGAWLRGEDIYDISLLREEGGYFKEELYSLRQERVKDAYFFDKDASYIDFFNLLKEGDVITASDTEIETVESVELDGSFTTRTEAVADVNGLLPAVLVPRTMAGKPGEKSGQIISITEEMDFTFEGITFDGENSFIEIICENGLQEDAEYCLTGTDDTGKTVKYYMSSMEDEKAVFTSETEQGISQQASSAELQLYKYEPQGDRSEAEAGESSKVGEMFCMILD